MEVKGDVTDEPDETFPVTLSSPDGATLADATATGTITDDDPEPSLTVGDVTVTEGDDGERDAVFQVTLSRASGFTVTADYATAQGSAFAPDDYTSADGELSFAPGETEKSVTVKVKGDTLDEPDQDFFLNLSEPAEGVAGRRAGQGHDRRRRRQRGPARDADHGRPGGPDQRSDAGLQLRRQHGRRHVRVPSRRRRRSRRAESGDSTRPLPDGAHAFEVRAQNGNGEDPTPERRTFTVDTVAPATTIASGPPRVTNDSDPVVHIALRRPGRADRVPDRGRGPDTRRSNAARRSTRAARWTTASTGSSRGPATGPATPTPPRPRMHFRVDTTPPSTSLGATTTAPSGEDEVRNVPPSATGAQGGGELPVSSDGHTTLRVSCPPHARFGCKGAILLMRGDTVIARAAYDVAPGGAWTSTSRCRWP